MSFSTSLSGLSAGLSSLSVTSNNLANIGDTVLIEECAPKSKTKTWVLKEVLEKAI